MGEDSDEVRIVTIEIQDLLKSIMATLKPILTRRRWIDQPAATHHQRATIEVYCVPVFDRPREVREEAKFPVTIRPMLRQNETLSVGVLNSPTTASKRMS